MATLTYDKEESFYFNMKEKTVRVIWKSAEQQGEEVGQKTRPQSEPKGQTKLLVC